MFRHQGETRTLSHNLRIASLLSFIAGTVNVAGFLAVKTLTTNVTGHFAFFIDEVFKLNWLEGLVYVGYVLAFLCGAFVSNTMIEIISRWNDRWIYVVPASVECMILAVVGSYGVSLVTTHPNAIAYSLLFAMGLQNSLVTRISNARVRTTHLTGLFTDLGIELSQLLFYTTTDQRHKLLSSIKLRAVIVGCFFIGGVLGGLIYVQVGLRVLLFAAAVLVAGLIYDSMKYRLILLHKNITTGITLRSGKQ